MSSHLFIQESVQETTVARNERDLMVPFHVTTEVSADIEPGVLISIQEAVEEALSLLVDTGQPVLLQQADRLVQVAMGLLKPSRELMEDRLQRRLTLKEILSEGDWLTAEDLNELQENRPANKSLPASDWKRRGRIFGVNVGGREYFARYQFDGMYQPLPVIREVLGELGEIADPWVIAAWFQFPNGWIANEKGQPIAPKDALNRKSDLMKATKNRTASYVA